jgi:amino acid adenylation domain-containing protein
VAEWQGDLLTLQLCNFLTFQETQPDRGKVGFAEHLPWPELRRGITMNYLAKPEQALQPEPDISSFAGFERDEIEHSIPARFELIAGKYPERPAVKSGGQGITYTALNKTANRLARAILSQRGQGQEPIALLFDHEAEEITALVGVLKAGKSYVALEPSYPKTRLNQILSDLQTGLLVTKTKHLSLATELAQDRCEVLNLDNLDPNLQADNLGLAILPDALMGIFYTSGSTGQPKGVERTHRSVLHRAWLEANDYRLCTDDNISLLYSCSFGASVADIVNALLNGATLCLYNVKKEGVDALAGWLNQEEITIFHLPVALFRQFLETLSDHEQFPKLRQLIPSGQLYKSDIERVRRYIPAECSLIQRLASSETGMVARLVIDRDTIIPGNIAPVGYPVEGVEIMILDESGAPAGANEVGEIAIRSRYLAPGYWRRPDLTEKAFRPDPEGGDKRIYRMGDLGRLQPDGCLEYLGRKDFQVKIRGYRVEIGEIEAVLHSLETIREAAVIAVDSQSGEKRLVAYIVPSGQPAPTASSLRTALAKKLPDYMIPVTFIVLEALPLTANGKLDRARLPEASRTRPNLDTPFVPAQTPIEEKLANIWAEVLDLEQVGLYDNFLDLGGHSLVATRLVSRVLNTFQVELSPQTLFRSSTVASMAALIAAYSQDDLEQILGELEELSEEEAERLLATESK